ncbi:DNA repair and recombination protein RadB [Candidatus Gugararchaeum adminiculabundum]|nr:DNA repair and recombination protein RadB [Candidatus Gugararchaeum adminiculabundum]
MAEPEDEDEGMEKLKKILSTGAAPPTFDMEDVKMPKFKFDLSKLKAKKMKTGVPGLDQLVGGGFRKGTVIAICGENGAGKTTLAMQMLREGGMKYSEPGLFISFDEHKSSMYANMESYGWDLRKLEREKKLVFIEYPAHEIEHFGAQESVIRDMIDSMGIERIAIDSIAPLALQYKDEEERRREMMKLFEKIRKWGCTTFVIAESIKDTLDRVPRTKYGVEVVSDGMVYLYNLRCKAKRSRGIEVVKLRGSAHKTGIWSMNISGKGITVFPNKPYKC